MDARTMIPVSQGLLDHLRAGWSQPIQIRAEQAIDDPGPVLTARTHTCPVDPSALLRALLAAGWTPPTPPTPPTPLREDDVDSVTDALSRARSAQDGR